MQVGRKILAQVDQFPEDKVMNAHIGKQQAGEKALDFVESGMVIGIGTGSTVHYFIKALAQKCQNGLEIEVIASSIESEKIAKESGIPFTDPLSLTRIDLTVDGADEIDPNWNMIKGGGGALTREKILAANSKEMIVIIDESKKVSQLGKRKLPVEILPFGHAMTIHDINQMGYQGEIRQTAQNAPFITDNGNYLFDIALRAPLQDPPKVHLSLITIPGVVETGLFFELATHLIIGYEEGKAEVFP